MSMPKTRNEGPRSAPAILAALAATIVIGYSAYAAYPYLRGPILVLDEAAIGTSTTITGRTARVSSLTVNGLPIALDEKGVFSVERAYPPGYTVVTVRGVDRFQRSATRTLTFVTKPYASEKNKNESGTTSPQNPKTNSSL